MLAPSQTAAASSKVMPAGMCASGALSRMQTNSACAPKPVDAEDVVTDLELGDGCADRLDLAGQLDAEDPPLRSAQAGEEAGEERLGAAHSRSRVRLTVVAWILTRTSSSSGTGRSTSSSRRTSGGPYLS